MIGRDTRNRTYTWQRPFLMSYTHPSLMLNSFDNCLALSPESALVFTLLASSGVIRSRRLDFMGSYAAMARSIWDFLRMPIRGFSVCMRATAPLPRMRATNTGFQWDFFRLHGTSAYGLPKREATLAITSSSVDIQTTAGAFGFDGGGLKNEPSPSIIPDSQCRSTASINLYYHSFPKCWSERGELNSRKLVPKTSASTTRLRSETEATSAQDSEATTTPYPEGSRAWLGWNAKFGCGGQNRTADLKVMSLPSYRCSTPL